MAIGIDPKNMLSHPAISLSTARKLLMEGLHINILKDKPYVEVPMFHVTLVDPNTGRYYLIVDVDELMAARSFTAEEIIDLAVGCGKPFEELEFPLDG